MKKQKDRGISEMRKIIKKKPYLIWYTKNVDDLSEDSIVENILNWGDFEDVRKMIKILGIRRTADIFRKQVLNKRDNYQPEIKNYFQLYFDKYASRNSR